MTAGNASFGSFGNGTYCTIVAKDVSKETPPVQSGAFYSNRPMLFAVRYHFTAGAGVTASTFTFQELLENGSFVNLANSDIAAVSLTAPGEASGTLTGPFLGLQVVLSGLAGGNITFLGLRVANVQ